jgi:membrane associated rhomboid family serine protease/ribosomal protein L40E
MPSPRPDDDHPAWIDRAAALAASVGLNPVRVRWKLQRRVNQWRAWRRRSEVRIEAIRYDHRVCPRCTAVNDREASVCHRCESSLSARPLELARRVGLGAPIVTSASAWLGIAIVAVYLRTALVGGDPMSISWNALYVHGANLPVGEGAGEPWRYATSIFLHADLIHLAFNLLALARVGPIIEQQFSRGALLACFLVTGVVASIGSAYLGLDGIGIGASGAVLGLIGAAGAAGHRAGTARGREIRNAMLRWGVATALFGLFVSVDNRAHAVGFVTGAALGLAVRPRWFAAGHRRGRLTSRIVGSVAGLGLAATFAAAMAPLASMSLHHTVEQIYVEANFGPELEALTRAVMEEAARTAAEDDQPPLQRLLER